MRMTKGGCIEKSERGNKRKKWGEECKELRGDEQEKKGSRGEKEKRERKENGQLREKGEGRLQNEGEVKDCGMGKKEQKKGVVSLMRGIEEEW